MIEMEERRRVFEAKIAELEKNYNGEKINTTEFVKIASGKDIINHHWLIEAGQVFKSRGWRMVARKSDNYKRMWILREDPWRVN